jgi:acyl transferase domain-containing protein/acyl carrier protein
MVAVRATEDEVLPLLVDGVSIAAVNGPRSVVLSGVEDAVAAVAARFEKSKRLRVSHAFHSSLMEPMLADFAAVAGQLTYHEPRIPVVSNVTGEIAGVQDAAYWVRHVREAVRFADGITILEGLGVSTFVEIGPDGVLSAMGADCVSDAVFVATQRADRDQPTTFLTALAQAYVRGVVVDWTPCFPGGRRVDLPTYPFQRQRFWPAPYRPAPADPVDGEFWAAVDDGDVAELTRSAGISGDRPFAEVLPALSAWRRERHAARTRDTWRYEVVWTPLPAGPVTLDGTWLVLEDAAHPHPAADALAAHGADVHRLTVGADMSRADLADRLRAAAGTPPAGTVSLLSAAPGAPDPAAVALTVVQAYADAGVDAPLWTVTTGAVTTGPGDTADPGAAGVWGLGRVAALELPHRWGGLVDLPAESAGDPLDGLIAAIGNDAHEDQLAVRDGVVLTRRIRRAAAPGTPWQPRGTVLVVGDTTGHVARWAAAAGATHVVVTEPVTGDPVTFPSDGVLTVAPCAGTDRTALADLLTRARSGGAPLTAVVLADRDEPAPATLGDTDPSTWDTTAVRTAAHLDELVHEDLDAFVVFTSVAGTWGGGGQAAAAVNAAVLDAVAQRRRAAGRAATAVAWGPWTGGDDERLRRRGVTALPPGAALQAMAGAVGSGTGAVVLADVDWARFAPAFTASRPSALLADLPDAQAAATADDTPAGDAGATAALRDRWAGLAGPERDRAALDLVRGTVAAVLGHGSTEAVPPGRPFTDLGFDSLTAVELRNRLGRATGLTLPPTLAFDHPTAHALAAHLRDAVLGDGPDLTGALFAELDRLEEGLSVSVPNSVTRSRAVLRLQAFINRLNDITEPVADEAPVLDGATDEELFAFIRGELGRA